MSHSPNTRRLLFRLVRACHLLSYSEIENILEKNPHLASLPLTYPKIPQLSTTPIRTYLSFLKYSFENKSIYYFAHGEDNFFFNVLKKLLQCGADANDCIDQRSLLEVAVMSAYVVNETFSLEAVTILINFGATQIPTGHMPFCTPLELCCVENHHPLVRIAECLLAQGANPNLSNSCSLLQRMACSNSTTGVQLLLKHGANPNHTFQDNTLEYIQHTPLEPAIFEAIALGNTNIVEMLLLHGARVPNFNHVYKICAPQMQSSLSLYYFKKKHFSRYLLQVRRVIFALVVSLARHLSLDASHVILQNVLPHQFILN